LRAVRSGTVGHSSERPFFCAGCGTAACTAFKTWEDEGAREQAGEQVRWNTARGDHRVPFFVAAAERIEDVRDLHAAKVLVFVACDRWPLLL
jgi:hypothetical protein